MKIFPIFLPFAACKRRCVFCDEFLLTGRRNIPDTSEVIDTLGAFRSSYRSDEKYQVAFYGGSFLSLEPHVMKQYIEAVLCNVPESELEGIRFSTTPDSVTEKTVNFLSDYPVSLVELGVQSFDEGVLTLAGRPHSARDIYKAADLLRSAEIDFGIHLMTGLPGSSLEKELLAANEAVSVGASQCRLNPTLVFRGTGLEGMLREGVYKARSIEEAIDSLWRMYVVLEGSGMKVIRMGLCLNGDGDLDDLVAGPYHPAIGDLVLSRVAFEMLFLLCSRSKNKAVVLPVTQQQRSFFTGHKKMVERLLGGEGIRAEFQIVDESVLDISRLLGDLCVCVSGGEVNEAFLNPPERFQELRSSHEAQRFCRNHVSSRP